MSRPYHHANPSKTLFKNPWQTPDESDANTSAGIASSSWLWQLPALLGNIPLEWAKELTGHNLSPVKVVTPDFDGLTYKKEAIKVTWLGHAGFLAEMPTINDQQPPIRILFDPVFSDWAGPSAWTCIRRRLPAPCSLEDLPEYHYVLISHNHYDHLDLPTIQRISQERGNAVHFVVPLGVKAFLVSNKIPASQIREMDWWDELSFPICAGHETASKLTLVCVPSQHASGRSVMDRCTTLWCGWVVKQAGSVGSRSPTETRIYHAGDTGYLGTKGPCPVFKEIGERYGPMDLSMIPIWRGGTLSFIASLGLRLTHNPLMSALHASPADAVQIHRDVRSRHTIAMHFATFAGSDTEAFEPVVELAQALQDNNIGDWTEEGGMGVVDVGKTVEILPKRQLD